jgi:5,10-methylenetetrahydrofolate reductase
VGFFRVVEVFPPMFPFREDDREPLALDEKVERFVEDVRGARDFGDLFLVANVKDPELLKLSSVEAAFILQDRTRVRAAPALVVRDMNRLQFLSTVVTAISFELDSLLVVWGDSYPASAKATNVRDFSSLGRALHEVNSIRRKARSPMRLLAPVDLNRLDSPKGKAQAEERLRAGAQYLLAQPPTTDAEEAFDTHSALLKKSGMSDRILLNIFPFRDERDVTECERNFGWRLPKGLHQAAAAGGDSLVSSEREVVRRLREEGFPGVYLSTRGAPSIATKLLA